MKRLFVLMSCVVALSSLGASAAGEPVKPKATWVPAPGSSATAIRVPAPSASPTVIRVPAPSASSTVIQVPAPAASATVIQVPADSKVRVVTAPVASAVTMYVPPPASVMVQGERPSGERMPFRAGVSTVTVEKMAQSVGCVGGQGAGLMTPQGPVEVYRMVCESGQMYMARCELRQCRAVSATPDGGYSAVTTGAADVKRQVLRRSEVPGLAIDWRCGACVRNDAFSVALKRAYEAEARKNGMFVSDSATANVAITQYSKRTFPLRSNLALQAVYGQNAVSVRETTAAFGGMNLLAATSAQKLFMEMRGRPL